jgi:hypothetical protein
VTHQTDYWDAINLGEGGKYTAVPKNTAISHFLSQLTPNNFQAPPASAAELPYELLRVGKGGYEIRRYPAMAAIRVPYTRRDDGFDTLADLTKGLNPLSPAMMNIPDNANEEKTMMWPIAYAMPGEASPRVTPPANLDKVGGEVVTVPEKVFAVQRFSDAAVEPTVRRARQQLQRACADDGLSWRNDTNNSLEFCQYDAIFSMGERRNEVRLELADGHPWER